MKKAVFEIGEFRFAEPAFRTASRLVAIKNEDGDVHFALEMQHDGEPGVWVEEPMFPWHQANLDSLIRATADFQNNIQKVLQYVHNHRNKQRSGDLSPERRDPRSHGDHPGCQCQGAIALAKAAQAQ